MQLEPFRKFPDALLECNGFISKKDGSAVALTATGKLVYAYMLSKGEFFVGKLESQHFETQSTIADKIGAEYKSVGKILRTFMDHGVIEGKKLRPGGVGQWRWNYHKVYTDIILWKGTIENFTILEETKPVLVIQPTPALDESDWSDLPF